MTLEPHEIQKLHEEYGGDVSKVAAALGLPADAPVSAAPKTRARRQERPSDLGNPNLRRHVISARNASFSTWPAQDQSKIQTARDNYEAGTHEMCQGRDRDWFVLYSIPRKVRTGARKFFHMDDFK